MHCHCRSAADPHSCWNLSHSGLQGFDAIGSEQMTITWTETCIIYTPNSLSFNAPGGPLSLGLQRVQHASIKDTNLTSFGSANYPNSYFVMDERLLLLGANKVPESCLCHA